MQRRCQELGMLKLCLTVRVVGVCETKPALSPGMPRLRRCQSLLPPRRWERTSERPTLDMRLCSEAAKPCQEGPHCDLPEPSQWRRGSSCWRSVLACCRAVLQSSPPGALIASVDDCLDRLYTELVPAEDVARMRVRLG